MFQFFPDVAQNSPSFPWSEKSLSILGFPGLWPPYTDLAVGSRKQYAINRTVLSLFSAQTLPSVSGASTTTVDYAQSI